MSKRRRRSFTPQFKAQVFLEVLAGLKSPSEVARQHKLKPELIACWKDIALEDWGPSSRPANERDQDRDRVDLTPREFEQEWLRGQKAMAMH